MTMREKRKRKIEIAAVILALLAVLLFSAWYGLRHENEDLTEKEILTEGQLAGMLQLNGISLEKVPESDSIYRSSYYESLAVEEGGETVSPVLFRSADLGEDDFYYLFYVLRDYGSEQIQKELESRSEEAGIFFYPVIYGKNISILFSCEDGGRTDAGGKDDSRRAAEMRRALSLGERIESAVLLNALGGEVREFEGESEHWSLTLPLSYYRGRYRTGAMESESLYASGILEFQYRDGSPNNVNVQSVSVESTVLSSGSGGDGFRFVEIRPDIYTEESGNFRIDYYLSEYHVTLTLEDGTRETILLREN